MNLTLTEICLLFLAVSQLISFLVYFGIYYGKAKKAIRDNDELPLNDQLDDLKREFHAFVSDSGYEQVVCKHAWETKFQKKRKTRGQDGCRCHD